MTAPRITSAWPSSAGGAEHTILFRSDRVRIDEQTWSAPFEAPSYESGAPTIVVASGGRAFLTGTTCQSVTMLAPSWPGARTASVYAKCERQPCTIFRFPCESVSSSALVQLTPAVLFHVYWRRRALAVGFPATPSQVEDDAFALLGFVRNRAVHRVGVRSGDGIRAERHRALARRAEHIMRLAIDNPHPIASLAEQLDTSPFHLAHVFRAVAGLSVHQYLMQLRFVAALDRLREGTRDLSALALELGFSHHSHFSLFFRRAIGYSPSDVRRMLTASTASDLQTVTPPCRLA